MNRLSNILKRGAEYLLYLLVLTLFVAVILGIVNVIKLGL